MFDVLWLGTGPAGEIDVPGDIESEAYRSSVWSRQLVRFVDEIKKRKEASDIGMLGTLYSGVWISPLKPFNVIYVSHKENQLEKYIRGVLDSETPITWDELALDEMRANCLGVVPNTFIVCGEGDHYCSSFCQFDAFRQASRQEQ